MTWVNSILSGDVIEQLERIPSDSVHCIITSPPYWGKRDYGVDGQIGVEDTAEEYINTIEAVAEQWYRILREDGSLLLNIGDTYENKERCLIPFRVAERLRDVGFCVRQDIVWEKEHGKPDPATDRRSCSHEYIFHCTKNTEYWYDESVADGDHSSVIEVQTATSELEHVAVFSEDLVEELIDGVVPQYVCDSCGKPYTRTYDRVPRPFTDPDRLQAQRAQELYVESELTIKHIEAVQSVGISDVGKAVQTEDGAGRNTDTVEKLASEAKAVLGGYYREFTMVERVPDGWEQQCSCDAKSVGGIVCDPFIGSGTTAVVAQKHGLQYVGIDLNDEYVATARDRVSGVEVKK